ncbi:MAG: 30S ribosomal protein S1 [Epsilonproteobacteria bacterium]|nr:30S ribosomal protein S1 [Campylobacterota bacterium]
MAEVNEKVLSNQEVNEGEEHIEDFAAMLEESFKKETSGENIVEGVIVEINDNIALVDVGKKSEGVLNISEITDSDGNVKYNVGDKIKVVITGFRNERPSVSHKKAIKKEKVKEFIENYDEESELVIEGKVVGKNRGGFIVENDENIEFFLPRSQAAYRDVNALVGKKIKAKVIKVDKENESIIISRKKFLDDERKKKKELIDRLLESDEIVEGVIKKITTYGMFVDIGGVDGLVHYSEISYKGPVNPANLYKEGETVAVKAIKYDKEKRHLSLSIKAVQEDPWESIKDQLEVGDVIKVTVSNIEPYGVFVDIGNDIEGFLHISEISWDKNIKNPKEYVEMGEELDVEVIEIDTESRRLRVSLKNLKPKPFEEFLQKYKAGDVVKGVITTITNFGAFVKIDGVEGLLHNEDTSWNRSDKCKDLYEVGQDIEVKITKIDRENEKISLSVKELLENPVQQYAKSHKVNEIVEGVVRDIKDFGVFVELEDNVDALIRKEDLGDLNIEDIKVGDKIESVIDFIDGHRNRIRLSVRKLAKIKEKAMLSEINKDDKMTLGDIIQDQLK